MERLRQRWADGPRTHLLIVCGVLVFLVVYLTGCVISVLVFGYMAAHHIS